MRLSESLTISRTTSVDDGYGGKTEGGTVTTTINGKVSIKNNEMKAKPNGYGFYRIITLITDSKDLVAKDKVKHNNVNYSLEHGKPLNQFLTIWYGYEV